MTASLWEEILLLALRHDIAAHCVARNEILAPHGIVAVLGETRAAAVQ
jgi:hypothetical protein